MSTTFSIYYYDKTSGDPTVGHIGIGFSASDQQLDQILSGNAREAINSYRLDGTDWFMMGSEPPRIGINESCYLEPSAHRALPETARLDFNCEIDINAILGLLGGLETSVHDHLLSNGDDLRLFDRFWFPGIQDCAVFANELYEAAGLSGGAGWYFDSLTDLSGSQSLRELDSTEPSILLPGTTLVHNGTLVGAALTNEQDSFVASSQAVFVHGLDGNDNLTGGALNDELHGDGGNDKISSGGGTDRLDGGDGVDSVSFSGISGGVHADLADGVYWLFGSSEANGILSGFESVIGTASHDWIEGSSTNDTIDGGDGNDELDGWSGSDLIHGGEGNDTIYGGYSWPESLLISDSQNFLYGDGGNDTIYGADENDVIEGGAGSDSLYGGGGNDVIIVDKDDVEVDGGSGDADEIFLVDGISSSSIAHVERLTSATNDIHDIAGRAWTFSAIGIELIGIDQINGGDADDVIVNNDTGRVLVGGAGNDQIVGGNGDDTIVADYDDSLIDGELGMDTLVLADGHIPLANSSGNIFGMERVTTAAGVISDIGSHDWTFNTNSLPFYQINEIHGGDGIDAITNDGKIKIIDGGAGDDVLTGGPSQDTLRGGDNNDTIYAAGNVKNFIEGGNHDDIIYADQFDEVDGGEGYDKLILTGLVLPASWKNIEEIVVGVSGSLTDGASHSAIWDFTDVKLDTKVTAITSLDLDDKITDNDLSHTIDGGAGNDVINGAKGNDTLTGGSGSDQLMGGEDNDILNADSSDLMIDGGTGTDTMKLSGSVLPQAFQSIEVLATSSTTFSDVAGRDAKWDFRPIAAITSVQVINGGDGNDTIWNNNQNRTINGGTGDDTITGGSLIDTINGGDGDDVIDGGDGNDILWGNAGIDTLLGGAGNDILQASGVDIVDGGAGTDTLVAAYGTLMPTWDGIEIISSGYTNVAAIDGVAVNWDFSTVTIAGSITKFTGTSGDDQLTVSNQSVSLAGGAGNDRLVVNGSANDLTGSTGNDQFIINGSVGSLSGGDDNDTFTINGSAKSVNGGDGHDVLISSGSTLSAGSVSEIEYIQANSLTITGGADTKIALGRDDGDTVPSGYINMSGRTVTTGSGNDRILGSGSPDTIYGGAGVDFIWGGDGSDYIAGGAGNDFLDGNSTAELAYHQIQYMITAYFDNPVGQPDNPSIFEGGRIHFVEAGDPTRVLAFASGSAYGKASGSATATLTFDSDDTNWFNANIQSYFSSDAGGMTDCAIDVHVEVLLDGTSIESMDTTLSVVAGRSEVTDWELPRLAESLDLEQGADTFEGGVGSGKDTVYHFSSNDMIMAMAGFTTTTSGNNTIVTFGGNSADQMTLIGYTGTVNSA